MLRVRRLRRPGLDAGSFDLADGECVVVRGPSGSGKTLLLRAIADLDPNQGRVELDGASREAMPAPSWRRRVTYVPGEPGWWADTVGPHFADWGAAEALVGELGLSPACRDWQIARLSTGERQRLALVRALLLEPRVLLLDEPTSGLDADTAAVVEGLISGRLARGAGVLWVTHDAAQARRLARRCLRLAGGAVTETGP